MKLAILMVTVLAGGPGIDFIPGGGKGVRLGTAGGITVPGNATPPLFEFASSTGVGMGTACACATVTGTMGETMTFNRASTAYCTKGNETTGIVNGDLVECGSGLPRVMPGGDGSGALGISIWEQRTNVALRSSEFENAAWTYLGSGTTQPTVTANTATAPDLTLTADTLVFAATTAVQRSVIYQVPGLTVASSHSVYAMETSAGSCPTGLGVCGASCNYVTVNAVTWTRAMREGDVWVGGQTPFLGNDSTIKSACSVYLWGDQQEAGAVASPYIKTAGTSATRVTELATFPLVSAVNNTGSAGASVSFGTLPATIVGGMISFNGGNTRALFFNVAARIFDGTNQSTVTAQSVATEHRYSSSWSGVTMQVSNVTDAIAGTPGPFTGALGTTGSTEVGGTVSQGLLNGVLKRVCLDPSTTRCQ